MKKMCISILAIMIIVTGIMYRYMTLDYIKTIDYSIVNQYGDYYTANKSLLIQEVVSEDGLTIYDYYTDFVVIYLKQSNGRIRFSRIQFFTDTFSFGRNNITIGTSKQKVERLLRNSKNCGTNDYYMCDDNGQLLELTTYIYIDEKVYEYGIAVAYDEYDKVCNIAIWSGGLN